MPSQSLHETAREGLSVVAEKVRKLPRIAQQFAPADILLIGCHKHRGFKRDIPLLGQGGVDATSTKMREASSDGADGVVGSTTDYSVV